MAEIKSTLDLIMEKTAGLVMTDEEKARAKSQEREKQARGLAIRLLDGSLRIRALEKEVVKSGGENPEEFRRMVGQSLIREADLGVEAGNGSDPLSGTSFQEGLTALWPQRAEEITAAVDLCEREYGHALVELKSQKAEEIMDGLKNRGIYGSALRPVVKAEMDQGTFKDRLIDSLNLS